MISTYVPQPTVVEADKRRINLDGLFRRMLGTGHCPLKDYDYANLAKAYGIGTGTMIAWIRKNGLDVRLEEETMGKIDHKKAMACYQEGLSDTKAAEVLGVSAPAVCQWRKKSGLRANGVKPATGPNPGPAILKAEAEKPPVVEVKPAASLEQLADHIIDLERKADTKAGEPVLDKELFMATLEAEAETAAVESMCKHEGEVSTCGDCPDMPCELTPEVKRKPATLNPEWAKAVDEMVASNKPKQDILGRIVPEIQLPSYDDLLSEVDRLERENGILRAVCFGAGVHGLDEWLKTEAMA